MGEVKNRATHAKSTCTYCTYDRENACTRPRLQLYAETHKLFIRKYAKTSHTPYERIILHITLHMLIPIEKFFFIRLSIDAGHAGAWHCTALGY